MNRRQEQYLDGVASATQRYVDAHNHRNAVIIEARHGGCSIDDIALKARTKPEVIAQIVGEEL